MASLDIDLYDFVFGALGVTNLSGDPVWDAVTKLLLPFVVMYMFISYIVKASRLGTWKVDILLSFIIGFIIVYKGFFALFADLSIYLLGLIIVWHTLGFIFSGKKPGERGGRLGPDGAQIVTGSGGGGTGGWVQSIARRSGVGYSYLNIPERDAAQKELTILGKEWKDTEEEAGVMHWDKLPESITKQRKGIRDRAATVMFKFDPVTRMKIISEISGYIPPAFRDELKDISKA